MLLFVLADENGRVESASHDGPTGAGAVEIEVPSDYDLMTEVNTLRHYVVRNGALVYDPLPEPEPLPDPLLARLDALEAENTSTQLALVEVYEMLLG